VSILKISKTLNLLPKQVEAVLNLFDSGCTIPFVARYRKEKTGELNEVQLEDIQKLNKQFLELEKRKVSVLDSIKEQNKLSQELQKEIENVDSLQELEDIYLPYKPKRKTRAIKAIEQGLEPLASIIAAQKITVRNDLIEQYVNKTKELLTPDDALNGALDIIAERVSENLQVRSKLRRLFNDKSVLKAKVVSTKAEEAVKYKDYFSVEEPISKMRPHRLLAILRAHNEGFLRLSVSPDEEQCVQTIKRLVIQAPTNAHLLIKAIEDSYKRLLKPSLENEIIQHYKLKADEASIEVFANNARDLLLASPLGNRNVLAIDPGFRTGCKVVCLDGNGKLLNNETLYIHSGRDEAAAAKQKIYNKIEIYKVNAIAIGNGTGGRETEQFIRNMRLPKEIVIVSVNESGASIYSASPVAREEFPDYDVTVRSAISIGRRLIDPLAELVKIDPKSIGVGQYQHDVDESLLNDKLTNTVSSCVNNVGVNLNTASKQLLSYVSGIGSAMAKNIVEYRNKAGYFKSRHDLLNVPRLGNSTFEQCAGFLRIPSSENMLDNTAVHPERYALVQKMCNDAGSNISDFIKQKKFLQISLEKYTGYEVGMPTLKDLIDELSKPGRDPRKQFKQIEFNEHITKPEHLQIGMTLKGVVTNVTAFGCFVDIGVHQDGLVHISNLTHQFISNPSEVVSVGKIVDVKVLEVDLARKRIGLSMKDVA
jgi:uncharacterized protein